MNIIEVVSSNISHVGYDETKGILVVKFKAGATYEYDKVPVLEFQNLLKAESIGKYFSSKIRNKYVTRKIDSFDPLILVDHLGE